MRMLISLTIGAAFLVSAPAQAMPRLHGEARLAQALDGRVAGKPVSCVNLRNVRSTQVIDGTAILYNVGGTIYVNRPDSGADELNDWDTMITKTPSTQLCDVDVVRMVDLHSHMDTGLVFLGEFVPYRKASRAE